VQLFAEEIGNILTGKVETLKTKTDEEVDIVLEGEREKQTGLKEIKEESDADELAAEDEKNTAIQEMGTGTTSLLLTDYDYFINKKWNMDDKYLQFKQKHEDRLKNIKKKSLKETFGQIRHFTSLAVSTATSYFDYQSVLIANEKNKTLESAKDKYEARKKWINENVDDENERTKLLGELERDYMAERSNINEDFRKKEAEAHKKMKPWLIAEAIANTAVAVTKALQGPPILRWIEAGLVAAAGAFQVAKIKKQEFARGGSFMVPPGYMDDSFPLNAFAQSGEEINIRPAEDVRRFGRSTDIGLGGGRGDVTIEIAEFAPITIERLDAENAEESVEIFIDGIKEGLPRFQEFVKTMGTEIAALEEES
jgi:hypothetical protein